MLGDGSERSGTEVQGNEETVNDISANGKAENGQESRMNQGTNTSLQTGTGDVNTGNLSSQAVEYEGVKGTGKYNYGEALQKSILFYELQRSGDLPENGRCNWRGDSALNDGSDVGLDLTGGLYDAGDNVKFNLPMAYTASMLAWSVYESRDSYIESGQLDYAIGDIRWITDYLIKCHPEENVYYYQVGDGNKDHTFWGAAECVEQRMERPAYCVTKENPGSTVTGSAAAALAAAAVVTEDLDKDYSELCISHAKSLYRFAKESASDSGYTAANGFYTSNSGFYDELSWAAVWLYLSTNEKQYLKEAEEYYKKANSDYIWAHCWDDVHYGAGLLLARLTKEAVYKEATEQHLDYWTTGTKSGERITYTPKGLAWLDSWGSLRYATTTAFLAAVYSEWEGCDAKKAKTYWDFAEAQTNYALGSTGRSFMVGFGENAPEHPHHRTAQGSYCDNMNEPGEHRHVLYGALVGGPDANDGYEDAVTDFCKNEVACDYNAGLTGVLAMMYAKYHGQTIRDFGAVEAPCEEYRVDCGVNVDGKDFVEIRAYAVNMTAWPARAAKNVEMRYFVDLSEVYEEGRTANDIVVSTNYMQAGTVGELTAWDEGRHIYYLPVYFDDGSLYPGGQEHYRKEVQIRLTNREGAWDNENDPSYQGLGKSGSVNPAEGVALYENGRLVFGSEPQ